MIDFAIIKKGLHQYVFRKGEYLDMPHIEGDIDTKIEFPEVLLTQVGDNTTIGQPTIKGAKVLGTIIRQFKGPKFEAAKYKAKSRYRRQWGYREELTRVRVDEIVVK